MTNKPIKLLHGERVVAVVPEACLNRVVWVIITNNVNGTHRMQCLQACEQPPGLQQLFNIGAVVCKELLDSVADAVEKAHKELKWTKEADSMTPA